MSVSDGLQELIFDRLVADAAVHAIVADRIYDGRPSTGSYPCITFGPSDYVPDNLECFSSREETIQIDCWSDDQARLNPCKRLADAVKKSLHLYEGAMVTHHLVVMKVGFVRVFLDRDGIKAHGVVSVTASIDEDAT
tara:strand:- start:39442 stop:39852 length:411 start_codon:yes stop_codon:yes gene_type:complete